MDSDNKSEPLSPKEFCFFVQKDEADGDTYAYFCPLTYFRENKQMPDEIYDALDEFVPEDMDEVMDNCYATSRSVDEVEAELLEQGFVKDEEFWEFMSDLDEQPLASEAAALAGS